MSKNNYYIIPKEDIEILNYNGLVETSESVKWNNDTTKFICKTRVGNDLLEGFTAYTHSEIKMVLEGAEWNTENI